MVMARDTGKDFQPCPEGTHLAVCCDVVEKGMVDTQWGPKEKVQLRWEIAEIQDDEGRPFLVMQQFNLTLAEGSTLRARLEAWRGRKFTAEELAGFDMEKLIGAPCQLQVVHNENQGRIWANVAAVMGLPRGMTAPKVSEDYVRDQDRDKGPKPQYGPTLAERQAAQQQTLSEEEEGERSKATRERLAGKYGNRGAPSDSLAGVKPGGEIPAGPAREPGEDDDIPF